MTCRRATDVRAGTYSERVRKGMEDLSFQVLILKSVNSFIASKVLRVMEHSAESVDLRKALAHPCIQDSSEHGNA